MGPCRMQQRAIRGKHMTPQPQAGEPSQPVASAHAMRVERDVKVTLRDGVRISRYVYRPQREGRVPARLAASPYQHEVDGRPADPLLLRLRRDRPGQCDQTATAA